MLKKFFFYLRKFDWQLVLVAVLLVAFGLMAINSIDSANPSSGFANFKKQFVFAGIGLALMVTIGMLDYRYLKTYAYVLVGFGALLLVAVLLFGTTVRGTKGWFNLFGGQPFQPVELVKVFLIILLARLFAGWRAEIVHLKHLLITLTIAIPIIALVLLQPDLGSAIILFAILLGMLALVIRRRAYWVAIIVVILVVVTVSWLFILKDYQKDRVLSFLDPSRDPYGSGYNIKQSIIAVGSGNIAGRGLGLGPQSTLNFLPAQETDFIYAVIAEDLGFTGSALVLACFAFAVYRLIRAARLAKDDFGTLVLSGIALYIIIQGTINIGMNIGLLPIAGVPLPFVSYGGSSLIASLIGLGVAQSIIVRGRLQRA
ncbi:MAG: rod shape-determining protein RodA [Patescibacteria group bacterium]|nr:rod shape-determining protein RodA [Patescibacteria group bacterium]MDD5716073.1 rod shape-determining protein RodA [Patescibacteria group bacterium]